METGGQEGNYTHVQYAVTKHYFRVADTDNLKSPKCCVSVQVSNYSFVLKVVLYLFNSFASTVQFPYLHTWEVFKECRQGGVSICLARVYNLVSTICVKTFIIYITCCRNLQVL
jgi:hypothetical protein